VTDILLRQVDSLDPWGVSLSMWAYGVLGRQAEPVLTALCRRGAAVMRGFTPVDCAAALAGWARLRARAARHREFLDALMAHALDALSGAPRDWEPRELAQSAWGLSRVGVGGRHRRLLLETLMDVVQRRLEQFGPRVRAGRRGGGAGAAAAAWVAVVPVACAWAAPASGVAA
jgi:hypothetical protein